MNGIKTSDVKYDFSGLSRGRLRAYHRAMEELERQQRSQQDLAVRELDDNMLDMLAAAGDLSVLDDDNWEGTKPENV